MHNLSPDLLARLTEVQNRMVLEYGVAVDIMSFCLGMMGQAAAEKHCARYEATYPER